MKGGLTAPRNVPSADSCQTSRAAFNEGGADRPPKHSISGKSRWMTRAFNEGGADRPPKRIPRNRC